jgi:hypothetical protein
MDSLTDPDTPRPEAGKQKHGGRQTSERGREQARANSYQHGFRAKVVFSAEMAQAIAERTRMLEEQFRPQGKYESSLISDMAVARVKLDRAADLLVANADRVVGRARDFWDHDQRERALKLFKRLPKNPPQLAHKLAGTKQGALLLLERWEGLSVAALAAGDWDEPQREMALDMLGTPLELRSSSTVVAAAGDKEALAALAAREIARLRSRVEQVLGPQDARNQADTIAGLRLADDDETRLLRCYESAARRDYNRAHAELLRVRGEGNKHDDECEVRDDATAGVATAPVVPAAARPPMEPPVAPCQPAEPPAEAHEPIIIGRGKSTPARDAMRELRAATQRYENERRRKGA